MINANASENSDLYRALKGGRSNFGIVTRFDMQAFEAPPLWGGMIQWNKITTPQAVDALIAWVNHREDDVNVSAIVIWKYQSAFQDTVITTSLVEAEGREAPTALDKWLSMPADRLLGSMCTATHKKLTDEMGSPAGYRKIWWTGHGQERPARLRAGAVAARGVGRLHGGAVPGRAATFTTRLMLQQSIPIIFSRRGEEQGGQFAGARPQAGENVVMLLFGVAVKGGVRRRSPWRASGCAWGATNTMAFAAAVRWQYINYAYDYQVPLASYGDENLARIRDAAAKYDPSGVFQTRHPPPLRLQDQQ